MNYLQSPERRWKQLISLPVIFSVAIPMVIFDIWLELYHRICFPLYGLPYVRRSQFIKIDRHRLSYLSPLEKLGCAYCGYANGFINYACMIAARTEEYWCGIKHASDENFTAPEHHRNFLEYGDEAGYHQLEESDVA